MLLVIFSIATHFTSINPLYDKYVSATTNKPTTTALFHDFLYGIPATAPNRNPPPAENTRFSNGNLEETPHQGLSPCFSRFDSLNYAHIHNEYFLLNGYLVNRVKLVKCG